MTTEPAVKDMPGEDTGRAGDLPASNGHAADPMPAPPNGPEAPAQAPVAGLYAKLAKIAGELTWVDKTGFNEAQKYSYVKAEDIANAVRRKLAEHGIAFVPSAIDVQVRDSVTGKQHVTTVKMHYLLTDGESGQQHESTWFGTGADSGDKGLLKAYTAAQKYFFIDLFQIPTGKDPDQEAERQQRAKAGDAKLTGPQLKKVIDAVMAAGVTDQEWKLFRTSLGASGDLALTTGHAKKIREWLDKRAAKASA